MRHVICVMSKLIYLQYDYYYIKEFLYYGTCIISPDYFITH